MTENLPTTIANDGFNPLPFEDQIRTALKWADPEDKWLLDGVEVPPNNHFLVVATETFLRRYREGEPPEIIRGNPLPDVDELNNAIPRSEWRIGKFTNQPETPFKETYGVYLLDQTTRDQCEYAHHTDGARIAVRKLHGCVTTERQLRGGAIVYPEVVLQSRPFKTSFGLRRRPHFHIVNWCEMSGTAEAPRLIPASASALTAAPTASTAEALDDIIPF
jgi:hypothetical protein